MSVLPVGFASASGVDVGDIGHSLRFRSAASARLSRTPSAAPTRRQVTFSFWFKRGTLGVSMRLFQTRDNGGSSANAFGIYLNAANDLDVYQYSSAYTLLFRTSAVFRDPTSWNHLVVAIDTTQATSADRVKLYLNGNALTSSTYTAPALNLDLYWDSAVQHNIGCFDSTGSYSNFFDGDFARIAVVSQQQLTPSSFGYQNTEINEWVSKSQSAVKAVVDAGGTNSFMLDFDDGASLTTLGYDKSSKGNNWTLNNVSLTAGSTYDWMLDVPGNSYATANPLDKGNVTLSDGNLKVTNTTYQDWHRGSIGMSSGKWAWEVTATSSSSGSPYEIGVAKSTGVLTTDPLTQSAVYAYYGSSGNKYNGSSAAYGATYTAGDVIRVELDLDAGTLVFFKNGTSQGTAYTGLSGTFFAMTGCGSGGVTQVTNLNFGQAPLHASATYHSAAGGYFRDAPTTGFKALCQANLPDPAILNPELHHNVVLATGANIKTTSEAVFPSNFFEWIKDRANANNHQLIDTVRGSSAVLQSNTTAAETTYSAPSGSSVGWAWKAGGAPVANNDGTIPAQVSANVDAGFSIVTYTGTGANATVGHGLGKAPGLVVVKKKAGGTFGAGYSDWCCYHKNQNAAPASGGTFLNLTNAFTASALYWNSTVPTSSVFSVGTSYYTNGSSAESYVAYCFAEIPGFSKIGSYTGNGSADNPFVECGFKPKFVMIKRSDSTGSWQMFDSLRAGYNVDNDQLVANTSAAEVTTDLLDITANGFKLCSTSTEVNASGGTYIYIAIADVCGKYALAR